MYHRIKKFFTHMIANQLVIFLLIIIIIITCIGTLAFHFVEWRTLFNSFYFTTITMSTIGYGDIVPLTHWGKIIAIIYGFMWAPLLIWFAWLLFQSRLHKLVKGSIHAYHKEIKEAEQLAFNTEKAIRKQNKKIKIIEEEIAENI